MVKKNQWYQWKPSHHEYLKWFRSTQDTQNQNNNLMCTDTKYWHWFCKWWDLVYLPLLEVVRWSPFGTEARWPASCVAPEWVHRSVSAHLPPSDALHCSTSTEQS